MGSSGFESKLVTTLREGYTLPFRFRPNLTRSPTVTSNYHNPAKQSFLLEALYQLVNKNTVQPVENQNPRGFCNRLFLLLKPNNRWRPVLDLSILNTFLNSESFKMETPEAIRTSLQAGEWVTSIDFKTHASINQFTWSFTVVAQEVKLMALQRGIRIHQYLDDWLVRASTLDTCLQHTQTLVTRCQELGWLVKSKNWLPTGFQLRRLPVRPERGQGQIHTRALAGLDRQDPVNTVRSAWSGSSCPS